MTIASEPAQEQAVEQPDELAAELAVEAKRRPLYSRLLRLRHIAPNAWQRALLGEGALALATLLVLADLATAWTLVVLPLAVAVFVKAHDLLAGVLGKALERPSPTAGGEMRNGVDPEGSTPRRAKQKG